MARISASPTAGRLPFHRWARDPFRLLMRWYDRYLQRIDLAALDETMLRDIGLTPEDLRRECATPFWR